MGLANVTGPAPSGTKFTPSALTLTSATPGGVGSILMRKLMDELAVQPRGDRGNTLRMIKHYRQPQGSASA